ncbi:MAG: hypothetical protein P8013_13590 [Candidatus Sulfobium sp.]|jgi:hypothetical protein
MQKMKIKIARYSILCAGFIMALLICPRANYGYGTNSSCVNVGIKNISYQGGGTYKITLSLKNISKARVVLTGFTREFFAQAEALGQWIKLMHDRDGVFPDGGNSSLPPGRELAVNSLVEIDRDTPSLYLNGFGEINLRFSYKLDVLCGARAGRTLSGEKLYWITPESDKWTLREGM